jgi:hypothetical protein
MAFRKIHIKVTQESLLDVLKDVKQTFSMSDAPDYLKKLVNRIDINFFIVNRPKWRLYGQAFLVAQQVKDDLAKKCLKLNAKVNPSIIIEGTVYFPIIEINKGMCHRITRRGQRHLVAHEFAHIIDSIVYKEVNGVYSISTQDKDHNENWVRKAKWMGGSGSELVPDEEIWC